MVGKDHGQKRPAFSIIAEATSAEQVTQLAEKYDIEVGASSVTETKIAENAPTETIP